MGGRRLSLSRAGIAVVLVSSCVTARPFPLAKVMGPFLAGVSSLLKGRAWRPGRADIPIERSVIFPNMRDVFLRFRSLVFTSFAWGEDGDCLEWGMQLSMDSLGGPGRTSQSGVC